MNNEHCCWNPAREKLFFFNLWTLNKYSKETDVIIAFIMFPFFSDGFPWAIPGPWSTWKFVEGLSGVLKGIFFNEACNPKTKIWLKKWIRRKEKERKMTINEKKERVKDEKKDGKKENIWKRKKGLKERKNKEKKKKEHEWKRRKG